MFIAHRGNDNHNYLENSEKAILNCLDRQYISGIECDIRLTQDNNIVLSHNMLIDFKSNGKGFIHNLTLEELLSYDFSGEKITVLKDMLSKINNKKILLLEIKEEKVNMIDNWIYALEPILRMYNYLNIYLCSFNYELIKTIKERFDIPIGLIIGYKMNKEKDTLSFDFLMYQYKSFKYNHKKTFVWTINDKDKMIKFKDKTDYIITDNAYKFV